MEILLADYLGDEFGGVTHDGITECHVGASGPDVAAEFVFDYLVNEVEFALGDLGVIQLHDRLGTGVVGTLN